MSNKEIVIENSCINEVRLYLSGAWVTRATKLKLLSGQTKVVIKNLCPDIDGASVFAHTAHAEINAVNFRKNYFKEPLLPQKSEEAKKELEKLREELLLIDSKISVIEFEKELLLNNRTLVSSEAGVKTEELKSASTFLKKSFESNRLEFLRLNKSKKETEDKIRKFELENEVFDKYGLKPSGEIAVDVYSDKEKEIELAINYYVGGAFWTPFYEVRAQEGQGKIGLKLKANIKQTSGEDWQNVRMVLSMASPNMSLNQPNLATWFLRPIKEVRYERDEVVKRSAMPKAKARLSVMKEEADFMEELRLEEELYMAASAAVPMMARDAASAVESSSGAEFIMSELLSVPNDEMRAFDVMVHSVDADFCHYAVPKLDKDVFLIGSIKEWQGLNLIRAEASVFYNGAYVGKTFIDPDAIKDALKISFGRDKGVLVSRHKARDFSGKKVFNSNLKTESGFVLSIKNSKAAAIDLMLLDQLPVSSDKTILVDVVDISGAKHNKESGEVVWMLSLKAGASIEKSLKYSVTYPPDVQLYLD